MRRISIVFAFFFTTSAGLAQYLPNSSQPFQFASIYNPAFTGVEPYTDLKLGYRDQWTGYGPNAPKFVQMTCNLRIRQPVDPSMNTLRSSASTQKIEIPFVKKMIQGLGVALYDEEVGAFSRVGGGMNYSVHLPVSAKVHWSTGVSLMAENTRLKPGQLSLGVNADQDPFYDQLVRSGMNRTQMNIRAGMLLYSSRFYFGVSYLPLFRATLSNSGGNLAQTQYRGTIQAGISMPIGPAVDLKPSVVVVSQVNNLWMVDYNLKLYMRQKIWGGVTYRSVQSVVGMIGFNVNRVLGIAYSYEASTGRFRQFSDGSHELILATRLNNFRHVNPQIW